MNKDEEFISWAVRNASLYFRELGPHDVGSQLFIDGEPVGILDSVNGDWCTISHPSGFLERVPMMKARYTYVVPDEEGSL